MSSLSEALWEDVPGQAVGQSDRAPGARRTVWEGPWPEGRAEPTRTQGRRPLWIAQTSGRGSPAPRARSTGRLLQQPG